MRNAIIQLDVNKIDVDDYLSESDLYENMPAPADYVEDWEDDTADPTKLFENITGLEYEPETRMVELDKEGWCTRKLSGFKEKMLKMSAKLIAMEASEMEEYFGSPEFDYDFYKIEVSMDDKCGVYIYQDGTLYTLDYFMRHHTHGERFHVGGIAAYHF